jgi:Ca2+-binding RTX toxin-like protein
MGNEAETMAKITGTSGNDLLEGKVLDDVLNGLAGDDVLVGLEGLDTLVGAKGNDQLFGDQALVEDYAWEDPTAIINGDNDTLKGGQDDDLLVGDGIAHVESSNPEGGAGYAEINGGNDTLRGGTGNDTMYGDGLVSAIGSSAGCQLFGGDDRLYAGTGDDIMFGDGIATISGQHGPVTNLRGGDDYLHGGAGNDIMYGDGIAEATLDGNADLYGGNDRMNGGDGDDVMYGDGIVNGIGPRTDGRLFAGDDILNGGNGNDIIFGDGHVSPGGSNQFEGGNDMIRGGNGDDILYGDAATDLAVNALSTAGADVFLFDAADGADIIMDFRFAFSEFNPNPDLIDLTATGLTWADLDSDGSGLLDAGDDHIAVIGADTVIDLGDAVGTGAGVNTVTVAGVTDLQLTDFIFA